MFQHLGGGRWPFSALLPQRIRPLASGKDTAPLVPWSPQKEPALETFDFSPMTLSWDLWPQELGGNTVMLFYSH